VPVGIIAVDGVQEGVVRTDIIVVRLMRTQGCRITVARRRRIAVVLMGVWSVPRGSS
jgi:hypothetical protein